MGKIGTLNKMRILQGKLKPGLPDKQKHHTTEHRMYKS